MTRPARAGHRRRRERDPAVVGLAGLLVLALLVVGAFQVNTAALLTGQTRYAAAFRDASGLAAGNEVRVAGVKVGTVTGVGLETTGSDLGSDLVVRVEFRVADDVPLGAATQAHIRIKTVLGQKYLAIEPSGPGRLAAGARIPVDHTSSPFDVLQAFKGLAAEIGRIDSAQLAQSFTALATAFADTPTEIGATLTNLAQVSQAIGSRDTELRTLLGHARDVSTVVAERNEELRRLIADSNLLLTELSRRRDAIDGLLTSTDQLAQQLTALVTENRATLAPALQQLRGVLTLLQQHRDGINHTLASLGPFLTRTSNAAGNGRWVDVYVRLVLG